LEVLGAEVPRTFEHLKRFIYQRTLRLEMSEESSIGDYAATVVS
jgi:hypothetical protein